MNRLGRYITEEEENFLNHMKSLVENIDEVERIEISGSVKKGTGVFGISDLDLWVITNSSNFSDGDLKNLIISSKKYTVKYIEISNRILLTVKKKHSQTVDSEYVPRAIYLREAFIKKKQPMCIRQLNTNSTL